MAVLSPCLKASWPACVVGNVRANDRITRLLVKVGVEPQEPPLQDREVGGLLVEHLLSDAVVPRRVWHTTERVRVHDAPHAPHRPVAQTYSQSPPEHLVDAGGLVPLQAESATVAPSRMHITSRDRMHDALHAEKDRAVHDAAPVTQLPPVHCWVLIGMFCTGHWLPGASCPSLRRQLTYRTWRQLGRHGPQARACQVKVHRWVCTQKRWVAGLVLEQWLSASKVPSERRQPTLLVRVPVWPHTVPEHVDHAPTVQFQEHELRWVHADRLVGFVPVQLLDDAGALAEFWHWTERVRFPVAPQTEGALQAEYCPVTHRYVHGVVQLAVLGGFVAEQKESATAVPSLRWHLTVRVLVPVPQSVPTHAP